MTRVIEFIIAVLIVVALFVLFGVFLPSKRTVSHSIETNHPVRQVYDTLSGFQRFGEWNPMRAHDPSVQFEISGPRTGEGARLEYASSNPAIGSGSLEVVESVQDTSVVLAAENADYGSGKTHTLELEESTSGKTLTITWTYEVDYGWDLPGRFAGMYVSRNVGDDIKRGLANLAGLIATMPNFDYGKLEVETVQLQPQHMLYVQTTAERNISAVQAAQDEALTAIGRVIEANDLEQAGPQQLVTTNFGTETYDFDVAVPVRMPADASSADDAADGVQGDADAAQTEQDALDAASPEDTWSADQDAADGVPADACATPVEPLDPMEEPTLSGNVRFGQTYAGCTLMAEYVGHPAALPLVRDMLRSYAAAHGYQIHQRAFEEYLSTPEEIEMGEARFHVYWPVQHPANPAPPAAAPQQPADTDGETAADATQPASAQQEADPVGE